MTAERVHEQCTGVTARWCPFHGDCTCPEGVGDATDCPLHRWNSTHGEAPPAHLEAVGRFVAEAGAMATVTASVVELARLVVLLEQQARTWAESTHSLRPTDIDHRYMQ